MNIYCNIIKKNIFKCLFEGKIQKETTPICALFSERVNYFLNFRVQFVSHMGNVFSHIIGLFSNKDE
jgi:hypothetical protein